MDELIGRLAAKAGVNDAVAESNIGIIPGFLRSEGFSHNIRVSIDRIPGVDAAISASAGSDSPTTFTGNRQKAAGTKLHGLGPHIGLGISRVQNVAHELFRLGDDKIETDGTAEIARMPGLGQLA